MTITASMVKELRERTGAGMMDCKAALREADGKMDDAVDWLRTKGLAAAAKKAGRTAAEGLIGVTGSENAAAMIELNSETDFVARNEQFQLLAGQIATTALAGHTSLDALNAAAITGDGRNVATAITELIATIGENMTLRRVAYLAVENGIVAQYTHSRIAPGLGKIGVIVAIESGLGDRTVLNDFGHKIAMHVAATNPVALTREDIPDAVAERERSIFKTQALESGKPESIVDKMVEGRMRKFFAESTLLQQAFVMEPDIKVADFVERTARDCGAALRIAAFRRFALGEGIEREQKDFADEVGALTRGD